MVNGKFFENSNESTPNLRYTVKDSENIAQSIQFPL